MEIKGLGDQIFIHDSHNLLNDMNFRGKLSAEYSIHKYQSDSDLYLFLNDYSNDKIIVFSSTNIERDFINTNFQKLELSFTSVFPDLDANLLGEVDVCFYQQIYSYYHELKSHGKSMDTQQLILKSVWNIDLGELYSPTNNLKVALSFLIDEKEIPESIREYVSLKLGIDLLDLKKNKAKLQDWILELISTYVRELKESKAHNYQLSDNLIQFFLMKCYDELKMDISDEIIHKESWLAKFQKEASKDILKDQILADVATLKILLRELLDIEFDLNRIDDLFQLSRLFSKTLYNIQINEFDLEEFLEFDMCYSNLYILFRKLLDEGKFEFLFNYPYNLRPFTVNKILPYIYYNFKEENIALVVFDGMSYDEWFILKDKLSNFDVEETESFAILPTITSFSRTAIFSGRVPREFMQDKKIDSKTEREGLFSFLKSKGLDERDFLYGRVDLNDNIIRTRSDGVGFQYLKGYKFLGLICSLFDDTSHETKIFGELKSNLYKNIQNNIESSRIIQLLEMLRDYGYKIVITSDHGNIFSTSNEIKPNKNLEFEKRKSSRCLIFDNEIFADSLIKNNPNKCFKYTYNIIPPELTLVFPIKNHSFSTRWKYSITHGGIMPEEWIVPLVVLK